MTGRQDYSAGRSLLLSGSAIALLMTSPALAAEWLGTSSTDWFTAGNWNPAAIPTGSTDVTINNGGSPNAATISAAGAVALNITLGSGDAQSGTLNVTGGTLSGVTTLKVGALGNGTVNITNGGTVGAGSVWLATDPGSSGTVTVSGTGSQLTPSSLYVGMDAGAIGQVTIENDASLASSVTVLGYYDAAASGTLTVTGATANTGSLTIGERGVGVFNLTGGSTGTSTSVTFGSYAIGNGTANISGSGTTWTTGGMNIGGTGAGTLTISSGATVNTTQSNTLLAPLYLGGTATVTGTGSKWLITGDPTSLSQAVLAIGTKANATATLNVAAGGTAEIAATASGTNGNFQQIRLGISSGSTGALTVTGTNSTFTTPYDVWAGYNAGTTGKISVSAGGTLNTGYTIIGATGAGDALVTGTGSVWTVSDTPNVPGDYPHGMRIASSASSTGTLTIADGGTVNLTAAGRSVTIGGATGSQATLNIGAAYGSPAVAPGTLDANSVVFSTGATSTINFNHTANDYVFAVGIQGTGGTVNFLSGTTILTGGDDGSFTYPNTYTGSTNIYAGATAQFGNGGATGLISGNIANDGAMIVKLSSLFTTYGGAISGNGTFEQSGSGTLALTGTSTYSGLTKVTSGTLQLGNGSNTGSVAGDIENNSHLMFNRSDSFAFNKQISGTGDVTKNGSGILTLASEQSYTGSTSVQQGTLRLGANNRLASTGSLFLFAGGTFDLNGFSQTVGDLSGPGTVAIGTGSFTAGTASNRTFAGRFTGSGAFTKAGSGTLTLTGDSSAYTGTTTVAAGTLAADGNLSASAVTVEAGATLRGSGTVGDVTVASSGILAGTQGQTLTTGDLTLSSGSIVSVALGAPGNSTGLFSVNGNVILDGTLTVANAGSFGQGLYRLIDYTGSLTDNGLDIGTLPLGATGAVQTSIANQVNLVVDEIPDGGPLIFWDGSNTTANDTVDGGSGTWSSTNTNWTNTAGTENGTYDPSALLIFAGTAGTVTVDAGISDALPLGAGLQFANDGFVVQGDDLALTATGTILRVGDGMLPGAGYIATISSNLTGVGGLEKTDLGTLILTGANSYGGGTVISYGTLRGSATSFGSGTILVDAALIIDQATDATFANTITGAGTLTKTGAGGLVLTADSSGFVGTTNVENGLLSVNGSLGGALNLLDGTRLQGAGTVGDVVAASGSTIAPGNSIDTLNVASVTFEAGSTYEVEVNAAGQSDGIVAAGTATINGGGVTVLAGSGSYAPATTYTILTAGGGRDGIFTEGATSNFAFLDPSLTYDANNVYLTMTRNDVGFENVGLTRNQIATGGGVESLGNGNAIYNAVLNLSADQARSAFDLLSGEIHASAKTAMIEDSRFLREAALDRLRVALAPDAGETSGVWGRVFGSAGEWNSDGNAATLERSTGGFFVGADAPVFDNWRVGSVAGYSGTRFGVPDRNASGSSDNYHFGLYGGTTVGDVAFRTGAAYTWSEFTMNRSATIPGFSDRLHGDYASGTAQVFGELGYGIDTDIAHFEPFANLAWVNQHTDRFTEAGGDAALKANAFDVDATFATLGLRASTSFDVNGVSVTARGSFGWRHALGDLTPEATMRFASGGDAFSIAGVPIARDAAVLDLGLDLQLTPDARFGISYGGQFGSGLSSQSVRASLDVRF